MSKLDAESAEYDGKEGCDPVRGFLVLLNVVNHVLVLFVIVYVAWLAWDLSNLVNLHALLCTIGYPLLMAEAIVALAGENVWSRCLTRRSNSHLHWILQAIGTACNVAGVLVMYSHKKTHFRSTHALTGVISVGGLCVVCLSGLPALFAARLRNSIRPVYSKFLHNLVGILCFVLGMLAQCYGYQTGWLRAGHPEMVLGMTVATGLVTVLSLFGALRQFREQFVGVAKSFAR